MSTARGPNIHITELLKFQCSQLEFPGSKNMAPSIRATEGPDCDHTRVTPRSDKDAKLSLLSPNASSISPTGRAGHEQGHARFPAIGQLGRPGPGHSQRSTRSTPPTTPHPPLWTRRQHACLSPTWARHQQAFLLRKGERSSRVHACPCN